MAEQDSPLRSATSAPMGSEFGLEYQAQIPSYGECCPGRQLLVVPQTGTPLLPFWRYLAMLAIGVAQGSTAVGSIDGFSL